MPINVPCKLYNCSYSHDYTFSLVCHCVRTRECEYVVTIVPVKDTGGVYIRDRAAGLYRLSAYVLAVMTTELLLVVLISSIFAFIVYWMAHVMPSVVNFIAHWLVLILMASAFQGFGLVTSVIMPTLSLKISMSRGFFLFCMLTSMVYG